MHPADGVQAGAALLPDGLPRRRPQEDNQVFSREGPIFELADGLGGIPYIQFSTYMSRSCKVYDKYHLSNTFFRIFACMVFILDGCSFHVAHV